MRRQARSNLVERQGMKPLGRTKMGLTEKGSQYERLSVEKLEGLGNS